MCCLNPRSVSKSRIIMPHTKCLCAYIQRQGVFTHVLLSFQLYCTASSSIRAQIGIVPRCALSHRIAKDPSIEQSVPIIGYFQLTQTLVYSLICSRKQWSGSEKRTNAECTRPLFSYIAVRWQLVELVRYDLHVFITTAIIRHQLTLPCSSPFCIDRCVLSDYHVDMKSVVAEDADTDWSCLVHFCPIGDGFGGM